MKVALILSVVALVAVKSTPYFPGAPGGPGGPLPGSFPYAPNRPFQVCNYLNNGRKEMQCCIKTGANCNRPPRQNGWLQPGYIPPPEFLNEVCCEANQACCEKDSTEIYAPRFSCCDDTEICSIVDKKGTCEPRVGNTIAPQPVTLQPGGQCPMDGSLPAFSGPNRQVVRCTVGSTDDNKMCESDYNCVQDLSGNADSGVCCLNTFTDVKNVITQIGCNQYGTCKTCVVGENDQDVGSAKCSWLSQGSYGDRNPRCVKNCLNFPNTACVLPHDDGELCPMTNDGIDDDKNSLVVNSGTCDKRCGLIGTGRAVGTNNNGNIVPAAPVDLDLDDVTDCCTDHPGDYCCDGWKRLATHCSKGRVNTGVSRCGVPVRGTPNQLYISNEPYNNAPYGTPGPTPYGQFPPYNQNNGGWQQGPPPCGQPGISPPCGGGYQPFGPFPYGGQPYGGNMYGGNMYGGFGYGRSGEKSLSSKSATLKNWMLLPPSMFYRPAPPRNDNRRQPKPYLINPSPYVCSCDKTCTTYTDCCSDYAEECQWDEATTTTPAPVG